MVRYQAATGNANAKRNTRAKHYVLFDKPEDKGAKLKAAYPDLGWVTDIDGHPTLPFSVAARLILPTGAVQTRRDVLLFEEFPTGQFFNRLWEHIVPQLNFQADNILSEVVRAAQAAPDQTPFISVNGDWEAVEGDIAGEWEGLAGQSAIAAAPPSRPPPQQAPPPTPPQWNPVEANTGVG